MGLGVFAFCVVFGCVFFGFYNVLPVLKRGCLRGWKGGGNLAGNDLGQGVAVLVGVLGEHPGEVALQGVSGLGAREVDVEGTKELVQSRHRLRGSQRFSFGVLHTPLYARPVK